MARRKNPRGTARNPRKVYDRGRIQAFVTPHGYQVMVDHQVVQGDTSYFSLPIRDVVAMARQLAMMADRGFRLTVGRNGHLYISPPKTTGKKHGSGLTDLDVLAALAQAIAQYQAYRQAEPEQWWMQYHLGRRPELAYDTERWDDMAAARSVVFVLTDELKIPYYQTRDLRYIVYGKLRRLRRLGLADYVDATGELACARRPDGAMAPQMWFLTDLGSEALAGRTRKQEAVLAQASG